MSQSSSSVFRLNDFIYLLIQSNGIEYVINNYLDLREDYYNNYKDDTDKEEKEN